MVLQLLDHLLQTLLEVAAIAGAGQQGAHVQREDGGVLEDVRHLVVDDLARQTFGDGGLAHAGVAHQQRVVLGAAAEDLDRALDLGLTADQGIDLTLFRFLVEVYAVGVQGFAALFDHGGFLALLRRLTVAGGTGFGRARLLGDAMGDIVDRVIAGHVLLLQEIGGVALPLREDGNQHIGAGDFLAAGGLDVDDRALDHALEAGRGLGVLAHGGGQGGQVGVHIQGERGLQADKVDVAGAHDGARFGVVDKRQQKVLQSGVFVPTLIGVGDRPVQGFFEVARK